MLSRAVRWYFTKSWRMTATARRCPSGSQVATSVPSHRTVPDEGWYKPASSLARVVLPEPLTPTRATTWPAPISIDTSRRLGSDRLGW